MSWIFASLPLLIFIVLTWWFAGYVLTRYVFGVRDGLAVFALSMPCGMLTYLLFVNAFSYLIFLPNTVWVVNIAFWIAGLWVLRRPKLPLVWEIYERKRLLLGAGSLLLFAAVFLLVAREIWGDSPGHVTMVQLLANGQFPLRFQCNPEELAAYQYGGNLLAAAAVVTSGIPPWNGLHVVIACVVYSIVSTVFLLAWRRTKSIAAGLLGVFIVYTLSHFAWLYLPLTSGGLAAQLSGVSSLSQLPETIAQLLIDPWRYGVVPPGYVTTNFAHALRTTSWAFGPFVIFVFLVLVETPFRNRWVKTLALAYVLGTTSFLQPASLILIAFGLGGFLILNVFFRRHFPRPDFSIWTVIGIGMVIAVIQGGVITDSVQSNLSGTRSNVTSYQFKPFTLPSCASGANNPECVLLSIANVGIAPILLVVIGWTTFRKRQDIAQVILVLGAVVSYILPSFIAYGYTEWNFLRVISFASWALAPFIAVLFYQWFRSRQVFGIAAAVVGLVLASYGGSVAAWVMIDGRWIGDTISLDFRGMIPPVEQAMMIESRKLPLDALVFDPSTCSPVTASRPGYLFGRYARSSLNRNSFGTLPEGFEQILQSPTTDLLRQYGYTHIFLDSYWYSMMSPTARQLLRTENFETIAESADETEYRVLLRVCSPDERCVPEITVLPTEDIPDDTS